MKFSVQTAVLPELDRAQVVEKLSRHGYDGVEWRLHEDYHVKPSEILEKAEEIKRLVMEGRNAIDIADQAKREGVPDLRESAIKKVKDGVLDITEMNRVTVE